MAKRKKKYRARRVKVYKYDEARVYWADAFSVDEWKDESELNSQNESYHVVKQLGTVIGLNGKHIALSAALDATNTTNSHGGTWFIPISLIRDIKIIKRSTDQYLGALCTKLKR